jgi:WD40 repeat protein
MKKLFYILAFFFPIVVFAQFNLYKDSPLDYAWKNVGNAGFTTGWATYTKLAFSPVDSLPYVAYTDYANTNKANLMKFDGANWVSVRNANFSSGSWAAYTSLAFSPTDGEPYIAYEDCCMADSAKATLMKFDGTNWVTVGTPRFSAGHSADYTSLAFSPSGEPYVAYSNYYANVMKFNGNNWVPVGNANFTAAEADYICLAFSPSGEPYVAYQDWELPIIYKATVKKFDGINWVNVGNAGFSAAGAYDLSIAFSPTGQPYVAFGEGDSTKGTVMRFDGTNWQNVGNACFTPHGVYCTSLAFSQQGELYFAFEDWTYTGKAIVMKFDGMNWVYVGSPTGFSAGNTTYISLAFSPFGQPYVAYLDYANSHKATVMKFDSVFVGINEPQASKFSVYPNPAMDKITVETPEAVKGTYLEIVNIESQQLITRQITKPKTQIDISTLLSGVYFVWVMGEKTVEVGKFIKQ